MHGTLSLLFGGACLAIEFLCEIGEMITQFAGHDEKQSGQRFLDSSAPRLIRHVVSCEAVGGGIEPLPAGKDQKLSRGVGQSPTYGARGARLLYLVHRTTEQS